MLADGARPLVSRVEQTEAPARVTVLSAASGDEIEAHRQNREQTPLLIGDDAPF